MKKYVAVFLVLASAVFTQCANAVGLGDIVVQSSMNQPLRARIPLLKVENLSETELVAQLASDEMFAKHKMSRDFIYTTIHFQVDLKNAAGPSVLLSTDKPLKEPSLDFLVALTWPAGNLVRGYTVLLNKP